MNRSSKRLAWAIAVVGIASLLWIRPVLAQTVPAKDAKAAEKPAEKEKAGQPDHEKIIREQSIYIPYEKLRKVFEKEGRGVFLPYEKFQELWQAAQEKTKPAAEQKPPVGYLITEAENEATVSKDVVRVKARLKIEILAEGWTEVPLRLADAAITEATLGGQPARVVSAGDAGYKLLVEKKGKQPEQFELVLEYAKAITRAPGQNSVSFQAPQAPVSRWRVRIPEAGVKVNLHPLIAATEAPPEKPAAKPAKPDEQKAATGGRAPEPKPEPKPAQPEETVVLAFVGAAPTVRIEWTPKAEGATGLEALASVQAEQQTWVNEGVIRTRAQLAYTISRAELGQLTLEAPAGQKVVNVFDANVRQWSVQADEKQQKISVQLFEPAKGSQSVTVELEEFAAQQKDGKVRIPVIRALGVGRQQGVVVVQVAEGLRAEAAQAGNLLQVDAADLPPALAQGRWAFAYRYASVPFDLVLSVEKVQPRIVVDSLLEAEIQPDRFTVDVLAIYTIKGAGVFRLDLDLPAGYEVRQVQGRAAAGAAAAQVDTHYLEGENKTHLVVNLRGKAMDRVGLGIELSKELHEPDLLTPTGKSAELAIPIPQFVPAPAPKPAPAPDVKPAAAPSPKPAAPAAKPAAAPAVKPAAAAPVAKPAAAPGPQPAPATAPQVAATNIERYSGRVMIYAPESLRVNPAQTAGLRPISFKEALEGMESVRGRKTSDARPVLAFAFGQEPVTLSVAAERRKPQVEVRQLLVARIEDGVVKYEATFVYTIDYSGVKSLRIDVPADVSGLRNTTKSLSDEVMTPPPANVAEGYVAWRFSSESELIGQREIKLVWDRKLDKLDLGTPVSIRIPVLKPVEADEMKVDRAWGKIVLAKSETIDINEPELSKGLRPIDPQHDLKPFAPVAGGARAFQFDDEWKLTIPVTRYELQEIKDTSIERAVVRMVVTRAREISVQALYRMRSVRQRLVVQLPAKATLGTQQRINGKLITLEKGQTDEYYVPLVGAGAEESFLLELQYTVPGDAGMLVCPEFPEAPPVQPLAPAVQKVYLCVYVPQELALLDKRGPWTEEFTWDLTDSLKWAPISRPRDRDPVAWVCQPLKLTDDFQVDGHLYVFSAMHPAPAPEGSLRLTVLDERWLSLGLIAVVVLCGLVLVPAGAATRAAAIGVLVVLGVACGVFLPIFAHQILNGVLAAAVFVVLVIWAVWFFMRTFPQIIARRVTRSEQPPPQPAPPASPFSPASSAGDASPPAPPSDAAPAGGTAPPLAPDAQDQPAPETDQGGQTHA